MRKLLITIAGVIIVLLITALSAPFLIPADVYKARLIGIVKQRTGRDLRIDGPIRFSVLPGIGLMVERVSLSSPPGGFTAEFLETERLVGRIKLGPLLHGAIEIDELNLTRPKIVFEVDKEGRRNWIFHPPPTPPSTSATRASSSGGFSVTPGTAILTGGTATYLDQRSSKSYSASSIDVTVSMPDPMAPLAAKGEAIWNAEKLTFEASVATPHALRAGENSAVSLKITSAPVKLDFQGELSGTRPHRAAGALELDAPSSRRLLAWLGLHRVPSEHGFGPFSLKGRIGIEGSDISLTDADITLDNAACRGSLNFSKHGHPTLSGELAIKDFDLSPYVEARSNSPANNAPSPSASGRAPPPSASGPAPVPPASTTPSVWSAARFDLAALQKLDADLKLRLAALRWGDLHLDNATMLLRLNHARLQLDIPGMALYGGNGAGEVSLDASAAVPSFTARTDLHEVRVQPLFHDLAGIDQLSGSGDIAFVLQGKGLNLYELVGSVGGNTSISLVNGAVGSEGITELMQGIAGPLASRKSVSKTLEFDTLSATGTVANGVLYNNDLKLSSSKLSATGEGTVDLSRRQINYVFSPSDARFAARINITGSWDNPSYTTQSVTIAPGMRPHSEKRRDLPKPTR